MQGSSKTPLRSRCCPAGCASDAFQSAQHIKDAAENPENGNKGKEQDRCDDPIPQARSDVTLDDSL